LDGDVILAAQSVVLARADDPVVIATTNIGYLTRYAPADLWASIAAPNP
jgi:hypothetical protein